VSVCLNAGLRNRSVMRSRNSTDGEISHLCHLFFSFKSFLNERSHRWTGVNPGSTAEPNSNGSLLRATDVNTAARRDEDEYKAVDELREKLRTGVVI